MKVKTKEAIERATKGLSLKGFILEDLNETQVSVREALTLARSGVVVPEANVYYDDSDINYDPDIDDVNWSDEYVELSWTEKEKLFTESNKANSTFELKLDLPTSDDQLRAWIELNQEKLSHILYPILRQLHIAEKSLEGRS